MPRSIAWLLALSALSAAASPETALACSPVKGYRVPTNIALIDQADLVVMARVVSGPTAYEARGMTQGVERAITLSVVRVLKGAAGVTTLKVDGVLSDPQDPLASVVTDLRTAHPSSFMGACIRQAYAKGGLVLAMFQKTRNGLVQIQKPFARAVEDVRDEGDLWPRAARLYITLTAHPDGPARRVMFAAEAARRRTAGGPDDQAIAHDIDQDLAERARPDADAPPAVGG